MKKKLSAEQALVQSLKDARDFEAGKRKLSTRTRELPDNPQVLLSSNSRIRTMNVTKKR